MRSDKRWELVPEDEFIFSGTENMVLAGFLEFSDGTMCVCSHDEGLSDLEVCKSSDLRTLPDEDWDLDEIPF